MTHEQAIADWFKENNPGTVTNQYWIGDITPEMILLEKLMEDPDFWEKDTEGMSYTANVIHFIPKFEHWRQLEEWGFHDPDFICATLVVDFPRIFVEFEIR